jgi:hypothetical protein
LSTPTIPTGRAGVLPRWSLLAYEMPGDDGPTRSHLWRHLRRLGALNLAHGSWAVPHSPSGDVEPALDPLCRRLRAAGASVRVAEVDGTCPEDHGLVDRLVLACTRLWAPFGGAADDVLRTAAGGPGPGGRLAEGVEALRQRFAATLPRDLVRSDEAETAARRLDDLTWIDGNVRRAEPPEHPAPACPMLAVAAVHPLVDGSLRVVARLDPLPPWRWEHAFAEFEAQLYRGDPGRPAVRHGTVTVCGPEAAMPGALDAVQARLDRFRGASPGSARP